ncbi:MAG: hypothetical protein AB7K63_19730 [Vicinamibacterales bacterium]
MFALTFLLALPLAVAMRGAIETHLGRSVVAAAVADGVDNDWWQEFAQSAAPREGVPYELATTLTPSVIGFAAVLENISGLVEARQPVTPVAAALAAYMLGWLFLSGGILDRYARQRPTRAHGFFAACGVYFFRFLRLGIIAGLAYWLLFTYAGEWLIADLFADINRDLGSERTAMLWAFALYGTLGLLLLIVNLVIDYAKVRAVVEDRRSMLFALIAAIGFIARNPGRVIGLYALNALAFLLLLAVWMLVAPGAGGAGAGMWMGFFAGQLYLLARLAMKLQFLASQTALFQHSLAHAGYVASGSPAWPEAPIVEGVASPSA